MAANAAIQSYLVFFSLLASQCPCGLSDGTTSSDSNLSDILIIVLTQSHPHHIKLAREFKESISDEMAYMDQSPPTVEFAQSLWPKPGTWTILPILPDIIQQFPDKKWIMFCDEGTRVKLNRLVATVNRYMHEQPVYIGRGLRDKEATIIHHFAFHESPGSFVYPDLYAGFMMSRALVKKDTDSSDSSKPGPLTLEEASLKHDVEQLRAEIAALKGYTAKRKPLKKKHEKNKFPVVSSSDTDGEETKDVKEKQSAPGGPSGTLSLKGKGRGKGKYNGEGVQAKRVLGSKLSPQKISIKKAGISTSKTVPQCSETKHKPTVRLNVGKPPKMRKLDAKPEEHSSSEDFQVTPSKPTKACHKPNTGTEPAAQGSPYECDVNVLGGGSQEQSSKLSVTILDDELNIVRMDGGKKLLEDVPYYHLVVDVLESAGKAYFFPPLNNLKPYAYQGKIGIGRPHPLREDTTMTEIKLSQRHRKVGRQNLSIVGKSHLKAAEIMDRFQAKQAQSKSNPQASTSNKRKGALPSTPYIRLYSSDESAYDPEDDWYAGIEGADDTVIAGNLWQEDRSSSSVIPMSQNNEQAQEKQREYLDTFQRVSDVLMQDEPAKENQTTQTESVSMTPAVPADTPIAEDVRKTLELCQSMNDRLDTLDYVAGNNDALVRAVEDLRNKFRQVKLDVASIKSGMVAKNKEKSVPKNGRLYVSTGTVTDGALSQDISTQTELGAAATKEKNGVHAVKQPGKGGPKAAANRQKSEGNVPEKRATRGQRAARLVEEK